MFGTFAARRVIWNDGREGVFEVYFDSHGSPIELGGEIRCDATYRADRSAKVTAALDEAARAEPLYDPEAWLGFPPTPEEELVEEKTDPVTGEILYFPLDEETKRWCLEVEERDNAAALARRRTWAPGQSESPDGDSNGDEP